jgi:PAS domain-containing protein
MAGSLTDISERKRAEAQLFEQNERAQVTLASIADAVITVSVGGQIEFLNPVAERLTGWASDEARGLPLTDVFTVHDETTARELADPTALALREGCPSSRRATSRCTGAPASPWRSTTARRPSAITPGRLWAPSSYSTT